MWRPRSARFTAQHFMAWTGEISSRTWAYHVQPETGMRASHGPESRRLLEKLIREILRADAQVVDHTAREAKRIGDAPPVVALQEVAKHAAGMRARFLDVLHAHDIAIHKGTLGATLATLRHIVIDRMIDPERSYRTALLDLRHGIDVVKLLREVARRVELFGVIRWCDDWLGARRTLVARVEAQLAWFPEQEMLAAQRAARVEEAVAEIEQQELAGSDDSREWHTDRIP